MVESSQQAGDAVLLKLGKVGWVVFFPQAIDPIIPQLAFLVINYLLLLERVQTSLQGANTLHNCNIFPLGFYF